jgi:ribosomal protein S24E
MEFKILKHIKNPLLGREEYDLHIISDSNPSFLDVKKHLGKDEDLTIVRSVKGNFGSRDFYSCVFVYNSKEAKENTEKTTRKERKKMADEAKKQAGAVKQEEKK